MGRWGEGKDREGRQGGKQGGKNGERKERESHVDSLLIVNYPLMKLEPPISTNQSKAPTLNSSFLGLISQYMCL